MLKRFTRVQQEGKEISRFFRQNPAAISDKGKFGMRDALFNRAYRAEAARRFRAFRARHLMRQEDLARILNVSRNTISSYERCVSEPQLRTLRKFVELERKLIDQGWVWEEKGT
jgi:DNA-binding XRE family transcriptional regulator